MPEPHIEIFELPGRVVLVGASFDRETSMSVRDMSIDGRPLSGGWLFHRGRSLDGGSRFTWIGRAGDLDPQAISLSFASQSAVPAAVHRPAFSIEEYLAGYATLADRLGLVRQLVESAPAILAIKAHAGFDALRKLALDAALKEGTEQPPASLFRLPGGMKLLLLADGAPAEGTVAVHVVEAGKVSRSTFRPITLPRAGAADAPAALLVQAGDDAVAALVGRRSIVGLPLRLAGSRLGPADLITVVRSNPYWGADLARYLLTVLAPYGAGRPDLATLFGELAALMPVVAATTIGRDNAPSGELTAAFATSGGSLVVAGTLRDPGDLVAGIDWKVCGGNAVSISRETLSWAPAGGGDDRTFVATAAVPAAASRFRQHRFDLVMRSGARVDLLAPPVPPAPCARRDLLLKFLHDHQDDDRLLARLQPAIAEEHAAHLDRPRVAEVIEVGSMPTDPSVAVVIPLYRTLTFLRQQAAAFAADVAMRQAELVLVLDSPEHRDELLAILDGLRAVYGLAARVVVHNDNLGYGPAVNSGAAVARAPMLVLMNSDVVPADDRWLPALLRRYRKSKRVGAVGPKLLYGDDSLQHAGLTFARDPQGRYYNTHYFKGYPRDFAGAARARRVPGLTGACVLIKRDVFHAIGGISEDYVVGDFEDSDLSLRLAERGLRVWYEPAAELYHYERESIVRNESYTDTAACRYNQHIHTLRWQSQLQRAIDSNLGYSF